VPASTMLLPLPTVMLSLASLVAVTVSLPLARVTELPDPPLRLYRRRCRY
jgi:hypothetical protein